LAAKLKQAGISFETNTSMDEMLALGMKSAPMLRVSDNLGEALLDFSEANEWLNTLKEALPYGH